MGKQLTAYHKRFLKQTQNTPQKNLTKTMVIILITELQVIEAREVDEALSMATNLMGIQVEHVSTVNQREEQVEEKNILCF